MLVGIGKVSEQTIWDNQSFLGLSSLGANFVVCHWGRSLGAALE